MYFAFKGADDEFVYGYIGAVIVDEIHKAKNGISQQGKALRTLKTPVRIGLSGTPMNKAEDLWNKILFYSGEMSKQIVGFRFDTLNKHFSNMGLLNGASTLGNNPDTDGCTYSPEDYESYINQLSQQSGFIVVTPDDFGGRKPTVDELKALAIKHNSDMIVVDQLSLMSDQQRADTPRVLNVPATTVSGWMRGAHEPSIDMLLTVCNFLNVPVGEMVGDNNYYVKSGEVTELQHTIAELREDADKLLRKHSEVLAERDMYKQMLHELEHKLADAERSKANYRLLIETLKADGAKEIAIKF